MAQLARTERRGRLVLFGLGFDLASHPVVVVIQKHPVLANHGDVDNAPGAQLRTFEVTVVGDGSAGERIP